MAIEPKTHFSCYPDIELGAVQQNSNKKEGLDPLFY